MEAGFLKSSYISVFTYVHACMANVANGPYSLLVRISYFICVPYTLNLLLCYLLIANGAGVVAIYQFLVFQWFV